MRGAWPITRFIRTAIGEKARLESESERYSDSYGVKVEGGVRIRALFGQLWGKSRGWSPNPGVIRTASG
ncbi:hypothetical protein [Bacillus sp. FJAT-27251]|uniref:hypothetical protein n=1 Tax=Bacillus sp. FJAT-27251 TaxID=1684142 RepID=UPI000B07A7B9|nr:hypothetical protein [Bacillus sp. FJAT-27251]